MIRLIRLIRLIRPIRPICSFFAGLVLCLPLCGCGHNAIVLDKGLGFHAGFDPEHLSADFRFVYGEALTLAVRDNIELEWVSDAEGGQEQSAADAKTASTLKIRIGRQANGATRDIIEAGATAEQLEALFGHSIE